MLSSLGRCKVYTQIVPRSSSGRLSQGPNASQDLPTYSVPDTEVAVHSFSTAISALCQTAQTVRGDQSSIGNTPGGWLYLTH